jgi:hypothetical protein
MDGNAATKCGFEILDEWIGERVRSLAAGRTSLQSKYQPPPRHNDHNETWYNVLVYRSAWLGKELSFFSV